MVSFRFDPWFDAILRDHVLVAARFHRYSDEDLDRTVQTPGDAVEFLRKCGHAWYDAYVEDASLSVNDVGWVLVDARTGRQVHV